LLIELVVLKKVWSGWGISQICRELKSHHLPEDIHIVHLFEALNQCQKNAGTPPPNIRGHGQVTMKQPGEDSEASWSSRSFFGVNVWGVGGWWVVLLFFFAWRFVVCQSLYDLGEGNTRIKATWKD